MSGARTHETAQLAIRLEAEGDVAYWTRTLRADERTLREAIARVGGRERDVRGYLRGGR